MTATLRLGVLTDVHLAEPDAPDAAWHARQPLGRSRDLLLEAVAQAKSDSVDHLVLLGDLANTADPRQYEWLLTALRASGLPSWVVPGNHDIDPHTGTPAAFERSLAAAPATVASSPLGGVRLGRVVVATGRLTSPAAGHFEQAAELPDVGPGLLLWLTHFPVIDVNPLLHAAQLRDAGALTNADVVRQALHTWPGPVLVLHGHQHVRTHITDRNLLQLGFGALAEEPHDTAVLEIAIGTAQPDRIAVTRSSRPMMGKVDQPFPALIDDERTHARWDTEAWRVELTSGR